MSAPLCSDVIDQVQDKPKVANRRMVAGDLEGLAFVMTGLMCKRNGGPGEASHASSCRFRSSRLCFNARMRILASRTASSSFRFLAALAALSALWTWA
jgi:hypothetical protein